jgi:hypothetical protein
MNKKKMVGNYLCTTTSGSLDEQKENGGNYLCTTTSCPLDEQKENGWELFMHHHFRSTR